MLETQRLTTDSAGLSRATELLLDGRLVAFPTETVYGLGAIATDPLAVARIFDAKGRPTFNPLIAHVASLENADTLVALPERARRLAQAFWPGPLTIVAKLREPSTISDLVTAGLPTLAVRIPAHPVAQALLRSVGAPIAAPSANPSGKVSPTTANHVLEGLSGRISAVLDGGPSAVGLESTIVGLDGESVRLLRPGGIASEALEEVLSGPLAPAGPEISSPGQLASHYAPEAAIRLNVQTPSSHETILGFGSGRADFNLSPAGDLAEAATNLFSALRTLDKLGRPIAVAPIPERGLGRAINDRLRRAAAPRGKPDTDTST